MAAVGAISRRIGASRVVHPVQERWGEAAVMSDVPEPPSRVVGWDPPSRSSAVRLVTLALVLAALAGLVFC